MHLNRKFLAAAGAAAASAACLAAVALAPTSSAATGTYVVSPGGQVTAANSGNLVFTDVTSSSKPKLTCTKFTGAGAARAGTHKFAPATYPGTTSSVDQAAVLNSESLTGCTNPTAGSVTVTPSLKWGLALSSLSSSGGTGYLYNVTAHVSAVSGKCAFDSKGAVYGTYNNTTGVFAGTTTPGLTLSNVTGSVCTLLNIKNGDKAYLSGSTKVTPLQKVTAS